LKKRIHALLCAAMVLCSVTGSALAEEVPVAVEAADLAGIVEQTFPTVPGLYPAEVKINEENGISRLEKVYYLTAADNPAAIPTGDFEREGKCYTLLDLLKNDQTETETKDHIEVITMNSETKDMAEILKQLEPELEISTEDGYTGILKLDHTSIAVEIAGYKTSNRTVSATRTYPNLSDADVSLIPKSVEEGGRTLTLADVDWQSAAADNVDGYDLALRYNAVATYTGTATSKYATGYTVTADYKGEVSRTSCDTIVYTAVFSSMDGGAISEQGNTFVINPMLILVPIGIAAVVVMCILGKKWYTHYQNKKRGYE